MRSTDDISNGSESAAIADDESHCDTCDDARWLRVEAPVGSPQFGRMVPCECQERVWGIRPADRLRQYSDLGPLARLTFANLDPGGREGRVDPASFRAAHEAAARYAQSPGGWLVIGGPSGTGKTHLAAAIANACIDREEPARFVAVPDLLDHLRTAFDPARGGEYDDLFAQVIGAPLLVLDDLGMQISTAWADEKLDQILTHRYNERLPTVVTTAIPLAELSDRLFTRLTDSTLSTVVSIDPGHGQVERADVGIEPRNLRSMTFELFDPRGGAGATADNRHSLREALKAARTFAENPSGWLYMAGPTGVGKTHLAVAIANDRLSRREPVVFRFVPDLLDELRRAYGPSGRGSFDRVFEAVRNAALLILDDLGSQATTAWAEEKLYQIIVHRHNAMLPTVITSRMYLEEMEESGEESLTVHYSEAIVSRLRDGHVVSERVIRGPDFRHRGAPAAASRRTRRTRRR